MKSNNQAIRCTKYSLNYFLWTKKFQRIKMTDKQKIKKGCGDDCVDMGFWDGRTEWVTVEVLAASQWCWGCVVQIPCSFTVIGDKGHHAMKTSMSLAHSSTPCCSATPFPGTPWLCVFLCVSWGGKSWLCVGWLVGIVKKRDCRRLLLDKILYDCEDELVWLIRRNDENETL